jgi:phage tail-like protein
MGLSPMSIGSLAAGAFNVRADASKFLVILDSWDYDLGAWSKVSGLSVTWDSCEYRIGDTMTHYAAPGVPKYTKVKLTRAACVDSMVVQQWLAETQKKPRPFSGSIRLMTSLGVPLVTWTFKELFPVGWSIGDFDSKAANVVTESLELAHTGFLSDDKLPSLF